jgi:hypothetical protein
MVASGLETVLIGDPVDGDELSFRWSVRIRSTRNGANVFGILSGLFLDSTLLYVIAILSFVTIFSNYKTILK